MYFIYDISFGVVDVKNAKSNQFKKQDELVSNLKSLVENSKSDYEKRLKELELRDESALIDLEELKISSVMAINKWKGECQQRDLLLQSQKVRYETNLSDLRLEVEKLKNKGEFCSKYHQGNEIESSNLIGSLRSEIADLKASLAREKEFNLVNAKNINPKTNQDGLAVNDLSVAISEVNTKASTILSPAAVSLSNAINSGDAFSTNAFTSGFNPTAVSETDLQSELKFTVSTLQKISDHQRRVLQRSIKMIQVLKLQVQFLYSSLKPEAIKSFGLSIKDGELATSNQELSTKLTLNPSYENFNYLLKYQPKEFLDILNYLKRIKVKINSENSSNALSTDEDASKFSVDKNALPLINAGNRRRISDNFSVKSINNTDISALISECINVMTTYVKEENSEFSGDISLEKLEPVATNSRLEQNIRMALGIRYSSCALLARRFEILRNKCFDMVDGTEKDLKAEVPFLKTAKGVRYAQDSKYVESFHILLGVADWVNRRLKSIPAAPYINNITKDLQSGLILLQLISVLFPKLLKEDETETYIKNSKIKDQDRLDFLFSLLERPKSPISFGGILTKDDLLEV